MYQHSITRSPAFFLSFQINFQDNEQLMNSQTAVLPTYSFYEELANSITHGIGILFSIAGLGVLTAFASVFGSVWHIVSCSIYGGTILLMSGVLDPCLTTSLFFSVDQIR